MCIREQESEELSCLFRTVCLFFYVAVWLCSCSALKDFWFGRSKAAKKKHTEDGLRSRGGGRGVEFDRLDTVRRTCLIVRSMSGGICGNW